MKFELHGVTAGYGRTTILRDVSLVVPTGTVVALLGPNGAGKTTLLRVASGLITPTEGEIHVDGQRLTGAAPHDFAAAGICHIPEGRGVFSTLTVRENLQLYRADASPELLAQVFTAFPRLEERQSQTAATMSGGEKQMLSLARALMAEPRIILLDEVSMGLAPQIVDEIFDALSLLTNTGAGLLLVEQYVTRALGAADFVYVLERGSVSACGEAAEFEEEQLATTYFGA